jgi:multicomponent Na+:H+ antiporter subunit B
VTRRARIALFACSSLPLGAFLLWALAGLPDFGRFDGSVARVVVPATLRERHTANVVGGVVFDVRGFDTLGEELILFASVVGIALLLRSFRAERDVRPRHRMPSDLIRLAGQLSIPVVFLLGLWLAAYGYVTPGGGFQGGVVLAAALALLWAAGSYRALKRAGPEPVVDFFGGVGAASFVVVGLVGLGADGVFLHNLLGPGRVGSLFSGGSIALLSWSAAIEVAAANVLLFLEFFEEYVLALVGEAPHRRRLAGAGRGNR